MSNNTPISELSGDQLAERIRETSKRLREASDILGTIIIGQPDVIGLTFLTLLCDGHALLEGVPGLGKTKLVENLSALFSLNHKIQQFTPDLLPRDLIGSEVMEETRDDKGGTHKKSRFVPGPLFTNLLLADEINRAGPRVQSGLLSAMQEKRITFQGHSHALPRPFHVLATQNPLDQEGTYPLPEAQRDRFLFKINVDYPNADSEKRIILETTSSLSEQFNAKSVFADGELRQMQEIVRAMPVGDKVVDYFMQLTRSLRPGENASKLAQDFIKPQGGPGTRAGQAFALAIRARAMMDGRSAPSIDDVRALAEPILVHRITPKLTANRMTSSQIITQAVAALN